MRPKMPEIMSAYVQTSNDRDAEAFGTLFAEDSIVRHVYRFSI